MGGRGDGAGVSGHAPADRRVGFVGLGTMGAPMAQHPLEAGWAVVGWNRTPERAQAVWDAGAERRPTPRAVAEAVELVVVSQYDDDALLAVVEGPDGVAAGCRPCSVVVETSTVSPAASRSAAAAVAERGGTLLRAPVSGNPVLVRAATVTFMCSGERAAYERCLPLFDLLGKAAFHLGEGEEARYAKLAVNLMVAGTMQLMAETLGLAEAAGLDRRAMLEVLSQSAIGSPFVAYKTDPLVAGDYSPTFSVDGLRKDLRLVIDVAGDARVPLPVTGLVDQLLAACQGAGWGHLDLAALVLLEQRLRGADDELAVPTDARSELDA